jgi:hypothetical protein
MVMKEETRRPLMTIRLQVVGFGEVADIPIAILRSNTKPLRSI